MYKYEIIDASKEKSNMSKTGTASLEELSKLIPSEIYEQIKNFGTMEMNIQAGSEIFIIKKIE